MTETSKNFIPEKFLNEAQDDPRTAFALMSLRGEWNEPKILNTSEEVFVLLEADISANVVEISDQGK